MKKTAKEKRHGWNGSGWITKPKRLAIYIRDGFVCVYCLADLREAPSSQITLDHIKLRSRGGSDTPDNLITACKSCNSRRNCKSLQTFADQAAINRVRRQKKRKLNLSLAKEMLKKRQQQHLQPEPALC